MQSTLDILREQSVAQAGLAPKPEDARPWLTRYIFVPFRNKKLSSYYQSEYNLVRLQAGIIERIKRFERSELDHEAVSKVPNDRWGRPMSVGYGNQGMKTHQRRPVDVVEGILRAHNPASISAGMEDNGICEVKVLTGMDDETLRFSLQEFFLPTLYRTAREQREQLEKAVAQAKDPLSGGVFIDTFGRERSYADVGQALLSSTLTAIRWGIMKYRKLQNAVEEFGRTGKSGKSELSSFDVNLCAWLEVPQPKLESILQSGNLQQHAAAVAAPVVKPTIMCFDCGNEANLLPDGSWPRRGCIPCGSKTFGREDEAESEPQTDGAPIVSTSNSASRLEQRQAEMRSRKVK